MTWRIFFISGRNKSQTSLKCVFVRIAFGRDSKMGFFFPEMGFGRARAFLLSEKHKTQFRIHHLKHTLNNIPFIVECQICNQRRAWHGLRFFFRSRSFSSLRCDEKRWNSTFLKNAIYKNIIYRVRWFEMIVWSFATLLICSFYIFVDVFSGDTTNLWFIFSFRSTNLFQIFFSLCSLALFRIWQKANCERAHSLKNPLLETI